MGALRVSLRQFLASMALILSWLSSVLSRERLLHNARFARLDELTSLLSHPLEQVEASLLLGLGRFGQVLRVPATKARRELGNS